MRSAGPGASIARPAGGPVHRLGRRGAAVRGGDAGGVMQGTSHCAVPCLLSLPALLAPPLWHVLAATLFCGFYNQHQTASINIPLQRDQKQHGGAGAGCDGWVWGWKGNEMGREALPASLTHTGGTCTRNNSSRVEHWIGTQTAVLAERKGQCGVSGRTARWWHGAWVGVVAGQGKAR